MSKKKHLTLEEIESLVNDPGFHEESDDENDPTDIVASPPDKVDVIFDEEDIDLDNLIEQNVAEVPGHIEIHYHANDEAGEETLPMSADAPNRKKRKLDSTWIKERLDFYVDTGNETEISERVSDIKNEFQDKTPVEVSEELFDEGIRKHIAQQSVIYASQNKRQDFLFSDDCLRQLIGFFLYTGCRSLPQEKLYWCEDEDIDDRFVRKCFSKNRYLEIKRYLHFNDNSTLGSNEPPRSFKIVPIIELMNEKFSKFRIFSKRLSIDKQMIQYDKNNYIFATVWKDNNNVRLLSNYRGSQPTQKVKRWSKRKKMLVTVDQPKCLAEYNSYIGGVDKMDWMINKIKIRGKKWYFPIFTYIIDMTVVNAHILYCMANENIPLLEFRRRIVKCYMSTSSLSDPKRSGRPSLSKQAKQRIPEEIRKSITGHHLERTEMGKQRKCAVCKVNVRKQCIVLYVMLDSMFTVFLNGINKSFIVVEHKIINLAYF
ncbi:piggyBac transposable element-derived protein 2-like [Macrobrachium rosenbergii]|uniref:piggyBac transposable element-derived protein 2-like n=1 Tax=Macrobrachium rosenbergii TaxID=79674 RepID=UPI0034D47901